MLSIPRTALAVAFSLPLLGGCGLDSLSQGQVRNLNATTEYSAMDLYDVDSKNNSNLLVSGTTSYTVSSYNGLDAGSYTFNIVGSGGSATAASATGSVTKSNHFVLITYLTGGKLQTSFLQEDETAPTSGNAKLRIFNAASSEAGGVDVYVTAHACNALTDTDTALASNLTGLQTAFTQILATSSGSSWNLCATATGNKQQLLLSASQTFKDQDIDTLVLTHTAGGVLLNGMLLAQQGALTTFPNQLARMRVVSDAQGAQAVSASVGGTALAVGAPSPTIGAYQAVTAGSIASTLSIGGTALADPGLKLTAGMDYTLLVAGTAAAPTVTLLSDNNTPSTSSSLPVKMRLVNGVNGLTNAAALTSDGIVVADGVSFGQASTYANIATATNSADLEASSGTVSLWSATSQTLASGAVYTAFLLGDYTPGNTPPVKPFLRQDRAPVSAASAASS